MFTSLLIDADVITIDVESGYFQAIYKEFKKELKVTYYLQSSVDVIPYKGATVIRLALNMTLSRAFTNNPSSRSNPFLTIFSWRVMAFSYRDYNVHV